MNGDGAGKGLAVPHLGAMRASQQPQHAQRMSDESQLEKSEACMHGMPCHHACSVRNGSACKPAHMRSAGKGACAFSGRTQQHSSLSASGSFSAHGVAAPRRHSASALHTRRLHPPAPPASPRVPPPVRLSPCLPHAPGRPSRTLFKQSASKTAENTVTLRRSDTANLALVSLHDKCSQQQWISVWQGWAVRRQPAGGRSGRG